MTAFLIAYLVIGIFGLVDKFCAIALGIAPEWIKTALFLNGAMVAWAIYLLARGANQ